MQLRAFDDLAIALGDALSLRCNHCDVFARMSLQSAPDWQQLQAERPSRIAVVLTCAACARPIVLVSGKLHYGNAVIDIENGFQQTPPPRDRFELRRLPLALQDLMSEALDCFRYGQFQALVLLARRITELAIGDGGATRRLQLFDEITETAALAELDPAQLRLCRTILFDLQPRDPVPALSRTQSTTLLTLLKDMLYEVYVRPANLRHAVRGEAAATATSSEQVDVELGDDTGKPVAR